jgi:hypothetical protein
LLLAPGLGIGVSVSQNTSLRRRCSVPKAAWKAPKSHHDWSASSMAALTVAGCPSVTCAVSPAWTCLFTPFSRASLLCFFMHSPKKALPNFGVAVPGGILLDLVRWPVCRRSASTLLNSSATAVYRVSIFFSIFPSPSPPIGLYLLKHSTRINFCLSVYLRLALSDVLSMVPNCAPTARSKHTSIGESKLPNVNVCVYVEYGSGIRLVRRSTCMLGRIARFGSDADSDSDSSIQAPESSASESSIQANGRGRGSESTNQTRFRSR